MKSSSLLTTCLVAGLATLTSLQLPSSLFAQSKKIAGPGPKVIELNMSSPEYQEVLSGPPTSHTMESGLVVVAPSRSIGKHSSKGYEEAIIVFEGSGEMRITDGPVLKLKPHVVLYCPPRTEHDVFNTGTTPLKYVYVAARVQ